MAIDVVLYRLNSYLFSFLPFYFFFTAGFILLVLILFSFNTVFALISTL